MIGDCEFQTRDCLAQIDMLDSRIGAWEHIDSAGALNRARELDHVAKQGVLHGITTGIKDIIDVAGMPTGCGTPIYANNVAKSDASCVAMARAAGAIIIGKTVTTELAAMQPARTRNPQNPDHTPGGSSAGSAAAVAAGMVRMAFGTQTAGSLIRPAAYCGVVGFKPTFGLVPLNGVKMQSDTLDTVGVFTRTVDDAARWYAAMTGSPLVEFPAPETARARPLRIALLTHLQDLADVDMAIAMAEAADALKAAGAHAREFRLPATFIGAESDQRTIQLVEMARHYAPEHRQHRSQLSESLVPLLDEGAGIAEDRYVAARNRFDALRKQAASLFSEWDAWLLPSATGAAPAGLATTGDPVFCRLMTALHLPAINLPVYRNKKRMPLGLQLVGARLQDEKLLTTASRIIDIMRHTTHD
jgi:amidase